MKDKLPLGIQSIKELLRGNYIYVDKTRIAQDLINEGKYYFMSRPRRFGKSLFISTLKEIFKGDKDLFSHCHIGTSDYDWKPHPVIHFDFTKIPTLSPEKLEVGLYETLKIAASTYGVELQGSSLQMQLANLVEQLSNQNKVAVLVDEYDKPIIDTLSKIETAETNRDVLRTFFGTLKGLDQYIKFVFITGVSKFSQVSLFSGFNNLTDITLDKRYATLMGYTKIELEGNFTYHIEAIAKERNADKNCIVDEITEWYNGYSFARDATQVYNPYSTLNYLNTGQPASYWFSSGTPSFLIEQVRKKPLSTTNLSLTKITRNELLNIQNLNRIDLRALMWQTGYLTLKGYDEETSLYILDFPNREVREAFFDSLLQEFQEIAPSDVATHAANTRQNLLTCNLEDFFSRIKTYYAKIPYHLFTHAKEGFYHAVFLSLLEAIGLKTRAEESTNIGRVDLVTETPDTVFIFELKIDQTSLLALNQTEIKKYCEKYSHQKQQLVLIGLNFNTHERNISDWKCKVLSPSCELLQELHSANHSE